MSRLESVSPIRIEDHPFWPFLADRIREGGPKDVPFALSQLTGGKRRPTGPKVARDALAYLRRHYADYMPVEVVDFDGRPVEL